MLLWLCPLSAGTALSIRMGITLPVSVSHAKNTAFASVILVTSFFGFVNTMVYHQSDLIIGFFTNDKEVVKLAQHIWWKVCVFNQTCALFGGLCGVATGLGMQWTLARFNILWLLVFVPPPI
jgi:Na+-driven multidrug efflux pump